MKELLKVTEMHSNTCAKIAQGVSSVFDIATSSIRLNIPAGVTKKIGPFRIGYYLKIISGAQVVTPSAEIQMDDGFFIIPPGQHVLIYAETATEIKYRFVA